MKTVIAADQNARVFAVLVASILTSACYAAIPDRSVTINVDVKVSEGTLPAKAVVVAGYGGRYAAAVLDANRHASLQLSLPDDATRAIVEIAPSPRSGTRVEGITNVEWLENGHVLETGFALPAARLIQFNSTQSEYSVEFELRPSISVQGSVSLAGGGSPDGVSVEILTDGRTVRTKGTSFDFKALPKGVGSWLLIGARDELEGRPLYVPAATTDVNLGDIVLPTGQRSALLNLTMSGRDGEARNFSVSNKFVTLVREAGDYGLFLELDENGKAIVAPNPATDPVHVMPGSYWVVPGEWSQSPQMLKVLNLLRTNRASELQRAGVPKVVLIADQTTTSTIDAAATITKFMKIPN